MKNDNFKTNHKNRVILTAVKIKIIKFSYSPPNANDYGQFLKGIKKDTVS